MAFGALLAALSRAIMDTHLMLKICELVHSNSCPGKNRAERELVSPVLLQILTRLIGSFGEN